MVSDLESIADMARALETPMHLEQTPHSDVFTYDLFHLVLCIEKIVFQLM